MVIARLLALDMPALTWIIRVLQFVTALEREWDERRIQVLQVLQVAYEVHAYRVRQIASLGLNPWAPQQDTWLH